MKIRKLKFRVVLAAAFASLFLLGPDVKAVDPKTDTIQSFLQDRPPIYRIVFLLTDFTNGIAKQPKLYEGGWSKDDFYLKQYVMPGATNANSQINSVTNLQSFWGVGKVGNTYWHMTSTKDLTRTELQPQVAPESNPIAAGALVSKLILDRTLNLGIELLKRGTIQWNGDSFVAEYEDGIVKVKKVTYHVGGQTTTIDHPRIYGQIIRENGQISGLKISEDCTNFGASYILDYKYNSNNPLPQNLPSSITRSRIIGPFNKSEPVEGMEILSVEFSNTNSHSPAIAYTTNNYVESTNTYNLLFSNNQYYTFSSNHSPRLLNFQKYQSPLSGVGNQKRKFIVIGIMILASVIPFSLLFFAARSKNEQKNNE